jgi:carbohydrate-binding DOMON domain-containing protein
MSELTKEQKFVIFWLYNRVAERIPTNPIKGASNDIILDGINVTETVKELLQDRLFV